MIDEGPTSMTLALPDGTTTGPFTLDQLAAAASVVVEPLTPKVAAFVI